MKKIILLIATLFTVVSLAGCTVSTDALEKGYDKLMNAKYVIYTETERWNRGDTNYESIHEITVYDNFVKVTYRDIETTKGSDEVYEEFSESYFDFDNLKSYSKEHGDDEFEVDEISYYQFYSLYGMMGEYYTYDEYDDLYDEENDVLNERHEETYNDTTITQTLEINMSKELTYTIEEVNTNTNNNEFTQVTFKFKKSKVVIPTV